MSNANTYDVGDRVKVFTSTPFQDAAGTPFDPDVVRFKVKGPDGAISTYTYGSSSEVAREDTGDYTLTIDVSTPGQWSYRIEGETSGGEHRGGDEGYFVVRQTNFQE